MDTFYKSEERGDIMSENQGLPLSEDSLVMKVFGYDALGDRDFVLGLAHDELGEVDFELAWKMRDARKRDTSGLATDLLFNASVTVTAE